MTREADSRTLAEHLYKYIDHLNPAYLYIENVREFLSWGPLMQDMKLENGVKKYKAHLEGQKSKIVWVEESYAKSNTFYKYRELVPWMVPDKSKLCQEYDLWREHIKGSGYDYDYRMLNAADFGAYTSRDRYFGIFAKSGFPIVFPKATHSKKNKVAETGLKPWKAVRDVLELEEEGKSIFGRKKPLVDNTLKRIYAGLVKFIANGDDTFIKKYFSGRPMGKVISLDGPAGTIKTKDGQAVVKCNFMLDYQNSTMRDIDEPCPTIMTHDTFGKVSPQFIVNSYSNGGQTTDIKGPAATVTAVPKANLTTTTFLDQQYGKSLPASVDQPCGSITANPKQALVEAEKWIMNNNSSTATNKSVSEPVPTITQRTHYILNPQYKNKGSSIEQPAPTIIARQDKAPLYFISCSRTDKLRIAIYDTDSEIMVKIKLFMVYYGIIDIKMRMLFVTELKRIQGFPSDYILTGNQTEQKKFIGNSVAPKVAKELVEYNYNALAEFLDIDKLGKINFGALHLLKLL